MLTKSEDDDGISDLDMVLIPDYSELFLVFLIYGG
jgi:hypothetical protein